MKILSILLLIFVLSISAIAQHNYEGQTVSRGNIFTDDTTMFEGQYLIFTKDSLEYYMENSQVRHMMDLREISEVQKYDGHYGNTGIWLGGFVGAGIGVAVALGTKETTRTGFIEETTIDTWPIYLFTGVGTLLGYLLGSAVEDWETVYSREDLSFLNKINFRRSAHNGVAVSYTISF